MKKNTLSLAIASALGLGAVAGFPAFAQAQEAQLEEVLVTGSRIRDANLFATSPVTTVTGAEFDLTGATRVEDLLNTIPQVSPSFDSFDVNPSVGFATADLYGLGTQRTLVLINGRRVQSGGIRSQAVDLNQIPAALVQRVEVLTGGASAVYGSDAMSGVVNFILDNNFEGVSISGGYSGYHHKNDNGYIQGLMDQRGFSYPTGSDGLDGEAYNLDIAVGSPIADGRGHAMGYFTWRENKEVRQGARDYSSCALNAAGTSCGGSSTAPNPNFLVFHPDMPGGGGFAHQTAGGSWAPGVGELYNYAPPNFFMRPDERWSLGSAVSYEINPNAQAYLETNVANTNTRIQIAESGTFFVNNLTLGAASPLLGSMFADLGLDPATDATVAVGKRNAEGGPRISSLDATSFRGVFGVRGEINDDWDYDVSYMLGRTTSTEGNINDFITTRLEDALLQCPPGSFSGCLPYNVWVPGGVTADAAGQLSGTGIRSNESELTSVSGFVTGVLPFTVPTASDQVSLVAGVEYRDESYIVDVDANMQTGAFAGQGGPRLPIAGGFDVTEVYFEAGIPLYEGGDVLQSINMDIGYRYSDYSTSGGADTYKIGIVADVTDNIRLRGGYNRAIRAANVGELFSDQQISLWGGEDPCAGTSPAFSQAQCANTGVSAAQYGNILASPASQYNQFSGGNLNLEPEQGDTYTFGVVTTPIENLTVSLDYYDIQITERIGTIGANTILRFCAQTGDPTLCDLVKRSPTGDLWIGSNPETSGQVVNLNANFGELNFKGLNLNANYSMPFLQGDLSASMLGTYTMEQEVVPLPGVNPAATYDCAGVINTTCTAPSTPDWRHTARVSYAQDNWTASLRWRYVGELDYVNTDGTTGTADQLLVNNGNKLSAENYFDLTGVIQLMDNFDITIGVNNIFDREVPMVGAGLARNANAPSGYDQLGRYAHATFGLRF